MLRNQPDACAATWHSNHILRRSTLHHSLNTNPGERNKPVACVQQHVAATTHSAATCPSNRTLCRSTACDCILQGLPLAGWHSCNKSWQLTVQARHMCVQPTRPQNAVPVNTDAYAYVPTRLCNACPNAWAQEQYKGKCTGFATLMIALHCACQHSSCMCTAHTHMQSLVARMQPCRSTTGFAKRALHAMIVPLVTLQCSDTSCSYT